MAGRPRDARGRFISRAAAEAQGIPWPTRGSGANAFSAMPNQSFRSAFAAARPRDDRGRFISRAAADAQGLAWPTFGLGATPNNPMLEASQPYYASPFQYFPPIHTPEQSFLSEFAAARPRDEQGRFISHAAADAQGLAWPTFGLGATPNNPMLEASQPYYASPSQYFPPIHTPEQSFLSEFAAARPRDEQGRFISHAAADAQGIPWPRFGFGATPNNAIQEALQPYYAAPSVYTPPTISTTPNFPPEFLSGLGFAAARPRDERGRFISRAEAEAKGIPWPTTGSASGIGSTPRASQTYNAAPTVSSPPAIAPGRSARAAFAAARPRDERGRFISRAEAEAKGIPWPTTGSASTRSTPRAPQTYNAAPTVNTPPTVAPGQSARAAFAAARPRDERGRFISRAEAEAKGIPWPTTGSASGIGSTPRASQTYNAAPTVSSPPAIAPGRSARAAFAAARPRDERGRFISRAEAEAKGIPWPTTGSASTRSTPRAPQTYNAAPTVNTPPTVAPGQSARAAFAAARPRDERGRFISRAEAEAKGIPWPTTGSASTRSTPRAPQTYNAAPTVSTPSASIPVTTFPTTFVVKRPQYSGGVGVYLKSVLKAVRLPLTNPPIYTRFYSFDYVHLYLLSRDVFVIGVYRNHKTPSGGGAKKLLYEFGEEIKGEQRKIGLEESKTVLGGDFNFDYYVDRSTLNEEMTNTIERFEKILNVEQVVSVNTHGAPEYKGNQNNIALTLSRGATNRPDDQLDYFGELPAVITGYNDPIGLKKSIWEAYELFLMKNRISMGNENRNLVNEDLRLSGPFKITNNMVRGYLLAQALDNAAGKCIDHIYVPKSIPGQRHCCTECNLLGIFETKKNGHHIIAVKVDLSESNKYTSTSLPKSADAKALNFIEEASTSQKSFKKTAAEQEDANAQYNLGVMYMNGTGVVKSDEEAVKWFKKSAEQGHANAQFHLGLMYKYGRCLPQSDEEAVTWFRKSAVQGNFDAQINLAYMHMDGKGVPQSDEEAVKWFRKSAEQGEANAQYNLGVMYMNGTGVVKSDEEAVKWYTKSAEQGDAYAQYNLGIMYKIGRGVLKSDEEAVKWLRKSAEQGKADAQFNLGLMFQLGKGVRQSYEEAIKWYTKSAEQGDEYAQCNLGWMHENGKGVPQSGEEAVKWYKKSAEQGNARAQNNLGSIYEYGKGIPQSDEDAVKWYTKSAEQGNADAQSNLGSMNKFGKGLPQSDEEAVKWYTKSAEQGDMRAQYSLGNIYMNGEGVLKSHEEAVKWYIKSAAQGYAKAQFNLGVMYMNGEAVSQSDEEAVKWYRKSAEQGFDCAQFNLGVMFQLGKGVRQSDEEAVKWYRKSAEQGYADAQFYLGNMYSSGKGVSHSDEEALKWYRKSAEQGNADAQNELGSRLRNGRGMPQSDYGAVKWSAKAPEQDDAQAQFDLGMMFLYGEGVPQSYYEAAKWFRKSAEQGEARAQFHLGLMYQLGIGILQSDEEGEKWYRKSAAQGYPPAKNALGIV